MINYTNNLWTLINLIQYVYPYEDIYEYKLNVTNEYTPIYRVGYSVTWTLQQCTCPLRHSAMYEYVGIRDGQMTIFFGPARSSFSRPGP